MPKGNTKKRILLEALPAQCFWINNGPILSDLKELHDALKHEVSDAQFEHHVTDTRNDFADWIEKTLGDGPCATKVRRAKQKKTMVRRLGECLHRYA